MNIELKPIAQKKLDQMAATVHGVLVKNEAGAWAAVSDAGRVMWLDGFEGRADETRAAVMPSEHGKNRYGLDMAYFRELFNRELNRPLAGFRPDELARVLARAARTADAAVLQEPEFQAARAQSGQGAEPVGFITSSGLNNLNASHPARAYPVGAMPSPFESHRLIYTHPHNGEQAEEWPTPDEELPPDESTVLALVGDYSEPMVVPARYSENSEQWYDVECVDRDGDQNTLYQVLRWTAMPQPPKSKED